MKRKLPQPLERVVSIVLVATAVFYIWRSWVGTFPGMGIAHTGILMGVCLILVFLYYPLTKKHVRLSLAVDSLLIAATIGILVYFIQWELNLDPHLIRQQPSATMINMGIALVLIVLEGTRRTVGLPVVIIALVFTAYCFFGKYIPGPLHHGGFDVRAIITYCVVETTGLWGIAMQVASTMIIIFVILSSLMRAGGGSDFFMDVARAGFGRYRGGPAKVAVVGSFLFGTISGSAAANVMSVGTLTIPMMKKIGYEPHVAGAIETVASCGGPLTPPVMGAVAFVMAEIVGVSYWSICLAAAIPAIVYYAGLFAAVDLHAAKLGLKGEPSEQIPSFRKALKGGWFLLIPLIVLIYLIGVMQWGPTRAGFVSVITMFVVSFLSKKTMIGPKKLWKALDGSIRDAMVVVVACASAGFIIGLVGISGLGITLSASLIDISHGSVFILLLLTAIVSLILGMGMSAIPCYIFLAILVGPALVKMGLPIMAAHLFILYFGLLSVITPPVAMAAFAASAIAGVGPMKIGYTAMKLAAVAYVLPFYFIYRPALLMMGTPVEIILAFVFAVVGVVFIAIATEGFVLHRANIIERIMFGIAGFALVSNVPLAVGIGFALAGAGLTSQVVRRRAAAAAIKQQAGDVSGTP